MDVVGLGQCSLDRVATVARFPRLEGKERLHGLRELPGGQVATALLAAGRLGLKAALISSVGDDAAADQTLAPLEAAGIDLGSVRRMAGAASQSAWIVVDERSGERTVFWYRDPALALDADALTPEEVTRGRVLLLDAGDIAVSRWAAERARERGIPVVLDADTPAEGIDALLGLVDFPVVSQGFAEDHFGAGGPEAAARALVERGARLAVVTLGERGAFGFARAGVAGPEATALASPGFASTVRDTTGAGDAFHGAFVWALLQGFDAARILRVANAVAALNCRSLGAQDGLPTRAELQDFLGTADPSA